MTMLGRFRRRIATAAMSRCVRKAVCDGGGGLAKGLYVKGRCRSHGHAWALQPQDCNNSSSNVQVCGMCIERGLVHRLIIYKSLPASEEHTP
jgi:DNA transposition AAA+ family ATPase